MRKLILAAFAVSAMLPQVTFAAANPNSNGVNKNCFGQGRSGYSNGTDRGPTDPTTGQVISDRAQSPATDGTSPNLNVQLNNEYKTACQAG